MGRFAGSGRILNVSLRQACLDSRRIAFILEEYAT